jgi:phage tail sheath protein FI
MRSYLQVSSVDSLSNSENTPNSMTRVRADRDAILFFARRLWERGSTGNVANGETFGQSENTDGSLTTFEDHFQIQADIVNNPQSSLNAGNRNIDGYFTFPAPAESIQIGFGILLR